MGTTLSGLIFVCSAACSMLPTLELTQSIALKRAYREENCFICGLICDNATYA